MKQDIYFPVSMKQVTYGHSTTSEPTNAQKMEDPSVLNQLRKKAFILRSKEKKLQHSKYQTKAFHSSKKEKGFN